MRVHPLIVAIGLAACGDDAAKTCTSVGPFDVGTDGVAQPLGSGPNEARAGRLKAADLPIVPSGLITWKAGDFVLANAKVALVIEDVGDSDLYDPWGGRPVGLARVANGAMIEPNNFGEFFILTGRSTVVTDSVSVIADGSDGGPAIVRARGKLHPIPFLESLLAGVFGEEWLDVDAAIDYELAPGSEHVDIRMRYASPRAEPKVLPSVMNALMYSKRTPVFQPTKGFDEGLDQSYVALTDEGATSWAYIPNGTFSGSLSASGFVGATTAGFTMPACNTLDRIHAQLVIGGPGVDGIVATVGRDRGEAQRVVTGTVTRGGVAAPGVHVHAVDVANDATYYSRALTDATGAFELHVPTGANVKLVTFKRGDVNGESTPGTGTAPVAIDLPATGSIHVTATENTTKMPVRVQVVPAADQPVPSVPKWFGEAPIAAGRLHVAFPTTGDITLPVPPGKWDVIVSRGYEYEVERQTVTVVAGATAEVDAQLQHVVDTTGIQCGDFHVHTSRSNDSDDDGLAKVAQAVGDGLELPVRSDHEWVGDFSAEIARLGLGAFAAGFPSIELTSMELWGHMGVFPLTPDPAQVNAGAPKWQTFPTAAAPDTKFETLAPPIVFEAVRARAEQPVVIINHPSGSTNYFGYVGYDPATGTASSTADWDTKFTLVEVFNNSDWVGNRNRNVVDWLGLLKAGRKIMAVGSSDSHGLSGSPVGYPRTCLRLGTDDPRALTASNVRDALAAGHGAISGGIYVTAKLGATQSGDSTTGAGSPQMLDVTVQAASWVDVTSLELVVDGVGDIMPIMPGDTDPTNHAIRFHKQLPIQVAATGGFVVVAAYGGQTLEPVHPGHIPFGVSEPIFVTP